MIGTMKQGVSLAVLASFALGAAASGARAQDMEALIAAAKQEGQLTAGMMVVCGFSYHDGEQDAWIAFDPADY